MLNISVTLPVPIYVIYTAPVRLLTTVPPSSKFSGTTPLYTVNSRTEV